MLLNGKNSEDALKFHNSSEWHRGWDSIIKKINIKRYHLKCPEELNSPGWWIWDRTWEKPKPFRRAAGAMQDISSQSEQDYTSLFRQENPTTTNICQLEASLLNHGSYLHLLVQHLQSKQEKVTSTQEWLSRTPEVFHVPCVKFTTC